MAIVVLDSKIFNRISAGEVVEKPASVVKELVENSIDAGATNISVEILDGGIKQIKVTDNGCGMNEEDVKKAFIPHATSKIKTLSDLDHIGTLGFRGEALASIASVSQVRMISKMEEFATGNVIEIAGGIVSSISEIGAPTGTQTTVNNLFFNTPARLKFLKKAKQEEAEITNIMCRFILANPNISFKYSANEKLIYQTVAGELKNAIYAVYGKECFDSLVPVNGQNGDVKISGYVAKPSFAKPNRTYQTLIVNGRYVINPLVSTGVMQAFDGFLMTNRFPFFVLNISLSTECVDVNVHPTKLEVKFENSSEIFKLIYASVKSSLDKTNTVLSYITETKKDKFVNSEEPVNLTPLSAGEGVSFENKTAQSTDNSILTSFIKVTESSKTLEDLTLKDESNLFNNILNKETDMFKNQMADRSYFENTVSEISKKPEQTDVFSESGIKVVGVLFKTYIIVEFENNAYFIDQHAGQERILFDKFENEFKNHTLCVQPLLVPEIVNVNYLESNFLTGRLEDLRNMGFEIEEFGANSFKISTIPQILTGINIQEFFNTMLAELNSFKTLSDIEFIRNKIATMACKSAVKAGDNLTENEIRVIINNMLKQTTPYLCPHGRPIIIKFSEYEIAKMFKRIL